MNTLSVPSRSRSGFAQIVLMVWACTAARANDTSLVILKNFPQPITSMTHDGHGNIWFNTGTDLYFFDGEEYRWERHLDRPQTLVYEKGALQEYVAKWDRYGRNKVNEPWAVNGSWAKYLPPGRNHIFTATDKQGVVWVTAGHNLFGFRITPHFNRSLIGHSLRGIAVLGRDLIVASYSGIFKNGVLVVDTTYCNGNIFPISPNEAWIPSSYIIRYFPKKNRVRPIPTVVNNTVRYSEFSHLARTRDTVWAGSAQVGLFRIVCDSISKVGFDQAIEYIYTEGETLYLATREGIFSGDGRIFKRIAQFPRLHFNFIEKIGDAWWACSTQGVWTWDGSRTPARNPFDGKPLGYVETYCVLKDRQGYFWVSSSAGLHRFRPGQDIHESFLTDTEFNKRSFAAVRDTFYFGSINGLVAFAPLRFPAIALEEKKPANPQMRIGAVLVLVLAGIGIFLFWKPTHAGQLLKQSVTGNAPKAPDPFLESLEAYILENIALVTVGSLSHFAGLSERTLYRVLQENYQVKPGDLIRQKKQDLIKKLIEHNPGISKEELAAKVGLSLPTVRSYLGNIQQLGSELTSEPRFPTR